MTLEGKIYVYPHVRRTKIVPVQFKMCIYLNYEDFFPAAVFR